MSKETVAIILFKNAEWWYFTAKKKMKKKKNVTDIKHFFTILQW
jgi:hypothetical protein